MRTTLFARIILALLAALAAALLLSSCRTGRDVVGVQVGPAPQAATAGGEQAGGEKGAEPLLSGVTPYTSTATPRITPSANPLTPAQTRRLIRTQSRAAARLARAQPRTVPLIQGRAAVNAPAATAVATSYKNEAPVTLATDSAVVNVATAAKNAQAAAGDGNVQQRTEPVKRTLWQRLTSLAGRLTSTLSWLLLGAVLLHAIGPGVGYGSGWLRRFVSKRRG